MKNNKLQPLFVAGLIIVLMMSFYNKLVMAQYSKNFRLQKSIIATAGRHSSISNNYKLANVLGQASPVGVTHNQNFKIISGFSWTVDFRTGVENSHLTVSDKYYLNQNYPNPFNPSTTIEFGIAKTGNVKIKIWNLLGQLVAQPVNKIFDVGNYKIILNASDLKSGIYFYQIQAEKFSEIKKMILTR